MGALFLLYYLVVQITFIYGYNNYLGCFTNRIDNQDLKISIENDDQFTPVQCIFTCQQQNYNYAAIESGDQCRCEREFRKDDQVPDDECQYSCITSEKCGGNNRSSIYSIVNSVNLRETDSTCLNTVYGYQGCFDGVTLDKMIGVVNSIDKCISLCAIDDNYAGIMNGSLCHCGSTLNQPSVDPSVCSIPCNRRSTYTSTDCCGGLHAMSIFNIKDYKSSLAEDPSQRHIRVKRDHLNDSLVTDLSTLFTSNTATAETVPLSTMTGASVSESTNTMLSSSVSSISTSVASVASTLSSSNPTDTSQTIQSIPDSTNTVTQVSTVSSSGQSSSSSGSSQETSISILSTSLPSPSATVAGSTLSNTNMPSTAFSLMSSQTSSYTDISIPITSQSSAQLSSATQPEQSSMPSTSITTSTSQQSTEPSSTGSSPNMISESTNTIPTGIIASSPTTTTNTMQPSMVSSQMSTASETISTIGQTSVSSMASVTPTESSSTITGKLIQFHCKNIDISLDAVL
ncbi:unnamed protein product [Rotaria magnacalcarata]|uniref:WSC domain-containing protein n=5 Tax=Rotaria magnacalcarata TaxID=392030 RepID=A0A816WTD3_9BILA|nr:unnamed protein product [Rotaria magnacalcarata]